MLLNTKKMIQPARDLFNKDISFHNETQQSTCLYGHSFTENHYPYTSYINSNLKVLF